MSANASTTPGHIPHEERLDIRKVPLLFRPFVWFWQTLEKFFDWILPKLTGNQETKEFSPYFSVFTCLMIGSALTVGVAVADKEYGIFLGDSIGWLDLTVGLFIATVKASLVLAFFMHLNHEAKLIHRVMALTAGFVFFMFFLCILALLDKPPHAQSFSEIRDPFTWKAPAYHGEGHGDDKGDAHHPAGEGDAHHDAAATPGAAHPSPPSEHAEELPGKPAESH